MIDSELPTGLRRPCTPSHPRKSAPHHRDFLGTPGISRPCFCGPRSPIDEWDRSGPRRRPTIWGTWPPNLSLPIGINHLAPGPVAETKSPPPRPSPSRRGAEVQKETFAPEWRFQEPVDWRDTDLDEKTLLEWFHLMLLGRQIDYRFQVLNRQGRAPFIISGAGHEAAQIGVGWPLKPKYDWISPYYRDVVLC